jgi:hypothetical protein
LSGLLPTQVAPEAAPALNAPLIGLALLVKKARVAAIAIPAMPRAGDPFTNLSPTQSLGFGGKVLRLQKKTPTAGLTSSHQHPFW